ncbi:2,3-bisphosphoglycerate-independent phosphoglycerate mutase [Pancytospora philotis]|nr:2,3-bisphosphoglycerate-independent phosphoglycerate mutase [Pancytospora philotis]
MPKVCLVVIDGFGVRSAPQEAASDDATVYAKKIHELQEEYGWVQLKASGRYVGLPESSAGNSEVGHMALGAGRRVTQSLLRINGEYESGNFNKRIAGIRLSPRVHLIGLCSDGGVHAYIDHLRYLMESLDAECLVHAIADGIDTPPGQFWDFVGAIKARVVSVAGRYYAMDRDGNDSRTDLVYRMLTGVGTDTVTGAQTIEVGFEQAVDKSTTEYALYTAKDRADEYIPPTRLSNDSVEADDTLIFFNYRADRMKQLVSRFTDFKHVYTMTDYGVPASGGVLFPPLRIADMLGDCLSSNGRSQMRIAESEKYAHVTYFFNGGKPERVRGERRAMAKSPAVECFSRAPATATKEVAAHCMAAVKDGIDFVLVNLAATDLVAHCGVYESVVEAVKATDSAVSAIAEACGQSGHALLITADHGNCEQMSKNGRPCKSHTANDVPFIIVNSKYKIDSEHHDRRETYELADVAPTVLTLMGIPVPAAMEGKAIVKRKAEF